MRDGQLVEEEDAPEKFLAAEESGLQNCWRSVSPHGLLCSYVQCYSCFYLF